MWLLQRRLLVLLHLVPWDELSFVSDRCRRSLVAFSGDTETGEHNPHWSLVNIPYLSFSTSRQNYSGWWLHTFNMNGDFMPVSLISLWSAQEYTNMERKEAEEGRGKMGYSLVLLRPVGRCFSYFLSYFFSYAPTYTCSYILYCARWFGSKGRKRRQNENACQAKNDGESASE